MLLDLISVAIGLALLIWGADRFVVGAAGTARNLGVPTLLIGLTIVGFATSAPEILVSVVAALAGRPSLALGNAIGSNIANVALVLGAVAAVRPILVTSTILRREMPLLLAVTLLTLALFLDLRLTRIDGFVMLGALVVVLYWIVRLGTGARAADPIEAEYEAEIPRDMPMRTAILWLAVGLAVLLVGSELLVDGALQLARELGVSELVIGVTLVAIGTSLPELAVSLVSALKGEQGLAIGNILGSNMFNLLAVIGLAVVIHPATVEPTVLTLHFFVMVAVTLVLFAMTYNYADAGRIGRLEGVALLVAFVAYHSYVVSQNLGQTLT
ncbi:calcium/sodium antiporter [Lentisalinibacter sediminis]|uniref:calcium/sodium antiporter n=1 Tax=Lentisalinibacter sediminis TaxID=2992237 RepID=UPI003862E163